MQGSVTNLDLGAIRVDGATQARVALNEDTVSEYTEALAEDGSDLPPVTVFFDGEHYWVGDGHHRYHAYTRAGRAAIPADVRVGTQRDAILHACGANSKHGLRRTNEDKRKAVGILLADPEWAKMSAREIARYCGVSNRFVSNLINEAAAAGKGVNVHSSGSATGSERGSSGTTAEQAPRRVSGATPAPPASTPVAAPGPSPTPSGASDNGAISAPGPAAQMPGEEPAPAGEAGCTDGEEAEGPTLAELAEELQAENDELRKQIEAMQADDQKAETLRWRQSYELARRAKDELQQRVVDREAELKRHVNALRRIGKAVGEDNLTKVAAAVEAFVRAQRPELVP